MPDDIFEEPRLVALYDQFDGQRDDLIHYVNIAKEFNAQSIVDIGCGTGCLAILLANSGFNVTAIDPAQKSVALARQKENAEKVDWLDGDVTILPDKRFDLALMTGNVAQVFLSDEEWDKTLKLIHGHLTTGGRFVFEVRDPAKEAWLDWTPEKTRQRVNIAGIGLVEGWCDLLNVDNDLVSFRWSYFFEQDGKTLTSESTLRFRSRAQIEKLLTEAGYVIEDVRDAPDRPGKEFVFITAAN